MVEIVEHHVHGAEIGRVGIQQDRLAGDGQDVLDALGVGGDLLDAAHDAGRSVPATRRRAVAR